MLFLMLWQCLAHITPSEYFLRYQVHLFIFNVNWALNTGPLHRASFLALCLYFNTWFYQVAEMPRLGLNLQSFYLSLPECCNYRHFFTMPGFSLIFFLSFLLLNFFPSHFLFLFLHFASILTVVLLFLFDFCCCFQYVCT